MVVRSGSILEALRISLGILLLIPTLSGAQTRPALAPRAHEAPAVRLLEPGAAPLAPLRYALKAPQAVTFHVAGSLEVKRDDQGRTIPFPTLALPVKLAPEKGTVAYGWQTPKFTTSPEDTQTAHIMTGLEGSTGQLQLAEGGRGVITQILVRAGPNDKGTQGALEVRTVSAMEMGKGMMGLLIVPFPEEPIGIGGRWQVERIAVRGPMSFKQFTTFTLVKRTGAVVELTYRVGGTYDEGSGFRPEELKLAVSGQGTCTVNAGLPMPVALSDDVTVKATITAPDGQQTFQTTRVGTRIESK
jgi:hypothetical protein